MPFLFCFPSPVIPGFNNGAILDCHIGLLEDKIEQLHVNSSWQRTGDGDAPTPISRRAIDPHLGTSIVAMCVPKLCPIAGILVSCSRQKDIVIWFSCNDYMSYNAHADGARCEPVC